MTEERSSIRISMKNRRISINPAAYEMLGKPPHFMFLWENEKRLMLMLGVWNPKRDYYTVPPSVREQRDQEICIHTVGFCAALERKFGWRYDRVYQVFGDVMPEPDYKILVFRMDEPVVLEEDAGYSKEKP